MAVPQPLNAACPQGGAGFQGSFTAPAGLRPAPHRSRLRGRARGAHPSLGPPRLGSARLGLPAWRRCGARPGAARPVPVQPGPAGSGPSRPVPAQPRRSRPGPSRALTRGAGLPGSCSAAGPGRARGVGRAGPWVSLCVGAWGCLCVCVPPAAPSPGQPRRRSGEGAGPPWGPEPAGASLAPRPLPGSVPGRAASTSTGAPQSLRGCFCGVFPTAAGERGGTQCLQSQLPCSCKIRKGWGFWGFFPSLSRRGAGQTEGELASQLRLYPEHAGARSSLAHSGHLHYTEEQEEGALELPPPP